MSSRIASSQAPMTLGEREALDKIQLVFLIPPLPSVFPVTAARVLTKSLLKDFVNHLLSKLCKQDDAKTIPGTDQWHLVADGDGVLDLGKWNARQSHQKVYKVMASPVVGEPDAPAPIQPEWAVLGGACTAGIKLLPLPDGEVFEIGESHIMLVVHYYPLKGKTGKKRSKVLTKKSFLVPADLRVVDLVKLFKSLGNVSGIGEVANAETKFLTTDVRSVIELGWKHGTELKLEVS